MKITVCIPGFRAHTLNPAIDSIRRQTWPDWELIVVGQGPERPLQDLVEELGKQDPRIRYLHVDRYGCTRARNAGIRASTGDIVAFMDDDCEADSEWLAVVAECFLADPEIMLVAGSVVEPRGKRRGLSKCPSFYAPEAIYDPNLGQDPPLDFGVMGANVSLRKSVVEKARYFDECLGPGSEFPGGEDTDIKLRFDALGLKMQCTPRAFVVHAGGTRYGLLALMNLSRNYARANGGLAGKQTLAGDPRGRKWLRYMIAECFRPRQLLVLPLGLHRIRHFISGYRHCLREYAYDRELDILVRRDSVGTPPSRAEHASISSPAVK